MDRSLSTKLIHAGECDERPEGAVVLPIYQSSTFELEYDGGEAYHDIRYIRLNNTPNHRVLAAKLAAIENAEAAMVAGSGMAAISTTLLTVLKAGDHILLQDCLYGGTHSLVSHDFPSLGIKHDFLGDDSSAWKKLLRPETKAIYVETIANPLLDVIDLEAVVKFAKEHNLVSIIDNTFASPVNFRPAEWGFDLSLHSGTKYLNGHSDIVCGAIIGKRPLVEQVTQKLNHLGGTLDPHACFLLHRGLKTLELRVRRQNENALALANFLSAQDVVQRVNYPWLEKNLKYSLAKKFLAQGGGGMVSFELKAGAKIKPFIEALEVAIYAPSLGGVETLVTLPARTSHVGLWKDEREKAGVRDELIRISVGIEAIDDLIADFKGALAHV